MISACGGRRVENVIAAREGGVLEHLGLEIARIGDLDIDDGSRLVAAGVDIIPSLEITGSTSGNSLIEDATVIVRERVHQGGPIAVPLESQPIFPPMVSQMVRVGEETGELEKMLGKIADFYEDEVDSSIATLTSILEPLMMIGVGMMVGVIIIAMYMPMFKMLTLLQ